MVDRKTRDAINSLEIKKSQVLCTKFTDYVRWAGRENIALMSFPDFVQSYHNRPGRSDEYVELCRYIKGLEDGSLTVQDVIFSNLPK